MARTTSVANQPTTNNMDKALYQAPTGLEELITDSPIIDELQIFIEGENDEDAVYEEEETIAFDANLAEHMDDNALSTLSSMLLGEVTADKDARKDWEKTYVKGLKLLGLRYEQRTEPWNGACGAFHPLLAEAVVKFQAESIMETFPAGGPVKTQIIGKETTEKKEAAQRVQADMNYQLTDRMVEYRPEHEKLLWALPLAGSAFKKVYYDPTLGRQVAMFIPAEDLIVPFGASSLENAERVTHVMRQTENEVHKLQVSKFYRNIELPEPTETLDDIEKQKAEEEGFTATLNDSRYCNYEIHANIVLPGFENDSPDGLALPYIITIEKSSTKVLSVYRNWIEGDPLYMKRQHFVHYTYVPGFGFYGFGLIHLVGGFAESATSILRQLVDAGTLSNLPGGYKSKGMRVKGDDTPIAPGEFRDVDIASGTLKDNILPLPYKEPSATLYNLLNTIVEEGRRFATAADLKISDMSANTPVGTTLAILERTLKVMSAVQARLHAAMKQEFKLLAAVIREYTPDTYDYDVDGGPQTKQSDYDMVEIIPVSDPNAATMSQKVVQYQAALQLAKDSPQFFDLPLLNRQMLDVLGIQNAEKLVPLAADMTPKDPVTENMAIMTGKPVKAFQYQDHEAHIAVHMAAMQDPKLAALIGQNPMAQQMQAAAMAHIQEHLAYAYKAAIEQELGVPLPADDDENPMTPQVEVEVSRMAAQAANQLLQKNTTEVAAQQAQQAAQDPIIQQQNKQLELDEKELLLKEKKLMVEAAAEADKLQLSRDELKFKQQQAGVNAGIKIAADRERSAADGVKTALSLRQAAQNQRKPDKEQ